jgi:predicted kinase
MEMIVFCGIQGAGKSVFYAERFAQTHVRLNLDMLRTGNRQDILLHACLAAQQPVVMDNTNPLARQRRRFSALGKAAGFQTALYFFDVPLEEALRRNASRSGAARVPDLAIRGTAAKLERPTADEGFDQTFRVTADETGGWIIEELTHEVR